MLWSVLKGMIPPDVRERVSHTARAQGSREIGPVGHADLCSRQSCARRRIAVPDHISSERQLSPSHVNSTSRPCNRRTAFSRSEEHTSELQSLMRISYAVFCLTKNKNKT